MNPFLEYERKFELINSILDSTNNLIPLLELNFQLDEKICYTVKQLFDFLGKILETLPEVLISGRKIENFKSEIIDVFSGVRKGWENFNEDSSQFFQAWDEFYLWWETFKQESEDMENNANSIFISMN